MNNIPEGYTRVTEVLKPYNNLHSIDPTVLAKAADRGSRVHKYCETYALGLFLPEIDADCNNYVQAFISWFDERVEKVLAIETRLNSEKHKLSGQLDLICSLKGSDEICLIDIKTPASASFTWQLQTAAYQLLALQCTGMEIQRRICLKLPKHTSTASIIEYLDHDSDSRLFLNALELFKLSNK